tara:strand:+ start:19143 stop:19613 length:471 start_codon:yes stop_codon:yes gene_type:complete
VKWDNIKMKKEPQHAQIAQVDISKRTEALLIANSVLEDGLKTKQKQKNVKNARKDIIKPMAVPVNVNTVFLEHMHIMTQMSTNVKIVQQGIFKMILPSCFVNDAKITMTQKSKLLNAMSVLILNVVLDGACMHQEHVRVVYQVNFKLIQTNVNNVL